MLDNIDTHIPYELNRTPARLGPPAEWVVLSGRHFKHACLRVRTKRYPYITRFFVELEHAVRTYGDYTKAYEARASTRKEEERQYDHDTQLNDEKDRYEMQERLLHSAQQTSARCREQERAKSARFVPPDAVPSREERLVLMQMSAGYTRAGSDPAYLRDCTLLFIRSQSGSVDARIKKVRAFGDDTNKDAEDRQVALFNAFKHLASDEKVVVLCKYGGKLVGDIAAVIALMDKASEQKFAYYDDDGDDELGDDNDAIGRLAIKDVRE